MLARKFESYRLHMAGITQGSYGLHMAGIIQDKQKCLIFIAVPQGRKNFSQIRSK